ncbi:hypothetical protein OIU84_005511 [Salix udensis]|uniref:Uncharacterized protein n=1 Tax=Salix udensis TaxID=889485 RepID=A0AAD6JX17_9ROSI|nr:hypothetical protein OIU84_005511 [Salix udensis]
MVTSSWRVAFPHRDTSPGLKILKLVRGRNKWVAWQNHRPFSKQQRKLFGNTLIQSGFFSILWLATANVKANSIR